MKKIIFVLMYLHALCLATEAQPTNKYVNDVTLPTPNAASLGKYGDIPVNNYTGVPNISIPIYTAQEGPLSIPVSLSYHSSGIKVAETAGWVGMGWNLNAGGMVTRTIRGIADDESGGYMQKWNTLLDPFGSSDGAIRTQQFLEATSGQLDTEPDLFSFSYPGGSGKFIIYQGAEIFLMPKNDLKVSFVRRNGSSGEIIRFTITNPNGTKFVFGHLDGEADTDMGLDKIEYDNIQANQLVPSNWHLRKIISADNNYEISLDYEQEKYRYRSPGSVVFTYNDPVATATAVNHNVVGYRLKTITTSTCVIDFAASTEREDLDHYSLNSSIPKAKRLDTIRVSTGITSDEFCTEYVLSYDYMNAYVCPNSSVYTYSSSELKRLRLNSIQQQNCDWISSSISLPPYTFEYHSGQLPPRLSNATDHWGYYNGACSNEGTSNIPDLKAGSWWGEITDPLFSPSFTADRESSESHMKIGVLNKINYPTGGSTTFTFEGNEIIVTSGTTANRSFFYNLSNCTNPTQQVLQGGQYVYACCNDQPTRDTVIFTAGQLGTSDLFYRLSIYDQSDSIPPNDQCYQPLSNNPDPEVFVKITDLDDTDFITQGIGSTAYTYGYGNCDSNNEFVGISNVSCCGNSCYIEENITSLLSEGLTPGHRYAIELISSYGTGKVEFGLFSISQSGGTISNQTVGGLRIKQISTSDGDSQTSNNIVKNYDYSSSPSTSNSSGYLYEKPRYFGNIYCMENINGCFASNGSTQVGLKIFATSIAPLAYVNGYHIGYTRVVESSPGNGRIEYSYKPEIDFGGVPSNEPNAYPFAPAPLRVRDGINTLTNIYNESAPDPINSAKPIHLYESYSDLPGDPIIYKIESKESTSGNPNTTTYPYYSITEYMPRTGTLRLESMTKVNDGVSVTTTYEYDNLGNHLFPTSQTITNSNGVKTKEVFNYAFDIGGTVMQALVDRNIIAQPVETKTFFIDNQQNSHQIGGSRVNYDFFYSDGTRNGSVDPFPYAHSFESYNANADGSGGYWKVKGEIQTYWADNIPGKSGYPKEFLHTDWDETETYDWVNGVIKTRQYKDFTWSYDYYAETRLVKTITDIDGQQVNYSYDGLMRLKEASARDGKAKTTYEYAYKGNGAVQNYVKTKLDFETVTLSALDIQETYQYLDGLGRPVQTIQKGYSDDNNDIVQLTEYDNQGRPYKVYEPYEVQGASGAYLSGQSIPQGLLQYYTLTEYETSPLSRKTAVTPPEWHATEFEYGSNVASITISGITYPANSLIVQTVTDPDGHKDITYADKKGRQLMTVRESDDGAQDAKTQYEYDDKDRLVKVVPPGASLSANFTIFQYQYDERDRITAKKIPDQGGWTYYRYDNRDLVTYMQDPMMRSRGQWLHTQYDNYGRQVQTGLINTALSIDPNQSTTFDEPLTKNYYDGYDFSGGAPAIYTGKLRRSDVKILGTNDWLTSYSFYDDYGRVSRSESNHHLNLGNGQAEVVTFNYDFADNVTFQNRVHTKADGTNTSILDETHYDHSARMIEAYHQIDGGTKVQLSELAYTAKDQIQNKKIGGTATSFLQQVNFQYLPNGFLKMMNSSNLSGVNSALPTCANGLPAQAAASSNVASNALFYMELGYDEQIIADAGNPIAKNGNISQMIWRVRGRDRQLYSYEYDYLNRLKDADYFDVNGSGLPSSDGKYTTNITYEDKRGNIASITRNSYLWDGSCWNVGQIDSLDFDYYAGTNRLIDVSDNATDATIRDKGFKYYDAAQNGADYDYDLNGNMIYDPSKAMTVEYNYLNMPTLMEFPDCKIIEFIYDAGGSKLSKVVRQDANVIKRKDYLGGIEYVNNRIEAIYHSEGRVYYEDGIGRYEYNLTDHLGNVRLSFTDKNGNGIIDATDNPETNEILSETHYYPFGMTMEGPWMQNAGRENPYLYNGKELNEEFGLNWSSYGAREYDASIGRWMSVDPLAEAAPDWTPYRYGFNNPLIYTDPDGMFESRDAAKAWAKENDVKTGWFSGNRIRENSDGSWSIDNRGDHTSVSDLGGDLGVITAVMVSDKDVMSMDVTGTSNFIFDNRSLTVTHRDGSKTETPLTNRLEIPEIDDRKGAAKKVVKTFTNVRKRIPKGAKYWDWLKGRWAKGGEFMSSDPVRYGKLFKKGEFPGRKPTSTHTEKGIRDVDRSMEELIKNGARWLNKHIDPPGS